jgi:hypothetical protein
VDLSAAIHLPDGIPATPKQLLVALFRALEEEMYYLNYTVGCVTKPESGCEEREAVIALKVRKPR